MVFRSLEMLGFGGLKNSFVPATRNQVENLIDHLLLVHDVLQPFRIGDHWITLINLDEFKQSHELKRIPTNRIWLVFRVNFFKLIFFFPPLLHPFHLVLELMDSRLKILEIMALEKQILIHFLLVFDHALLTVVLHAKVAHHFFRLENGVWLEHLEALKAVV